MEGMRLRERKQGEYLSEMRTKPTDQNSRRQTDKWIEGFQNLLLQHDIKARTGPNVIKVAIIDSGIDYNHLEVDRSRIRDWKSWIENSDATVDTVGHGTHIAGIILQLTTNVELYIGKVTGTKKFKRRDLITEVLIFQVFICGGYYLLKK
jgi:subtilisin family serine protease